MASTLQNIFHEFSEKTQENKVDIKGKQYQVQRCSGNKFQEFCALYSERKWN